MILSIIIFLLMMTLVIFLHEGGHFLMAKLFNIYTKAFSIGFGPILYKKKFKETEFQIRAIPLGGMVEIPMEYVKDEVPKDVSPDRFYVNKKPYQKFLVAFAGPLSNVIVAYLLFSIIVSFVGIAPTTVDYVFTHSPSYNLLQPGDQIVSIAGKKIYSPGELSYFLKPNNSNKFPALVKRNGKLIHMELSTFYTSPKKDLVVLGKINNINKINSAGPTHYTYDDQDYVWINGEKHKIYSYYSTQREKVIGIILRTFVPLLKTSTGNLLKDDKILKVGSIPIKSSYDLQQAIYKYFGYKDGKIYTEITISNDTVTSTIIGGYSKIPVVVLRSGKEISTYLTIKGLSSLELYPIKYTKLNFFEGVPMTDQFFELSVRGLFSKQAVKDVSGPVGIAYFIYKSRNAGFMALVNIFALISLGLAIFNLIPIPPLDGSRMLYSLIEMITRRKLNEKFQMIVDNVGIIFMIMLVIFFTYNDIMRMFK